MHPVNGGLSVSSHYESYDPCRALSAAVILMAMKDYCQARKSLTTPKKKEKVVAGKRKYTYELCRNAPQEYAEAKAFLTGSDGRTIFFEEIEFPPLTEEKLDKFYTVFLERGTVSREAAAGLFRRTVDEYNK